MNERMTRFLRSPVTTHTLVGVVAFGSGVAVGYFMSRRQTIILPKPDDLDDQLKFNFDTEGLADSRMIIDEETYSSPATIPSVEEEPRELVLAPESKTPGGIVPSFKQEEVVTETVLVDNQPVQTNVFAAEDEDWDYEIEIAYREKNQEGPYILHRDEFYGNEQEFIQTTLTYYSGDDIMVDEEDDIVSNYEKSVGPLKFGHGSGDRNVFYVRNIKRRAEYEVLYDPGSYSIDVLGYEIEEQAEAQDIKHSRVSKFRDRD